MCFARKVAIYPNIKKVSEEKQQKKKRKISSRTVFKAFLHSCLKCGVPQGEAIISKLNEYE